MELELIENLLFSSLRAGIPLLLCGLGVMITEKSGVLNLGQEGMMLISAVISFIVAYNSGNLAVAVLCGALAGCAASLLFAFVTLGLRANQVASGLALTILGTGLSSFLGINYLGEAVESIPTLDIPFLTNLPLLGKVIFGQDYLVYLTLVLTLIFWRLCFHSRFGLMLHALGENPGIANKLGISVIPLRLLAVSIGGLLAGLAGAYLSLSYTPVWTEGISAGRGWIALALVVFAGWRMGPLVFGAFLFGFTSVLNLLLQSFNWSVSANVLAMLPYTLTIAVLVAMNIRSTRAGSARDLLSPRSLGQIYIPEK